MKERILGLLSSTVKDTAVIEMVVKFNKQTKKEITK